MVHVAAQKDLFVLCVVRQDIAVFLKYDDTKNPPWPHICQRKPAPDAMSSGSNFCVISRFLDHSGRGLL
jgi:hypothetical protein